MSTSTMTPNQTPIPTLTPISTPTSTDDAIHLEVQIAAPRERVFQAMSDPLQVPLWWGQPGDHRTTRVEADLRPGGKWLSEGIHADGRTYEVHGEYLEVEPPNLFAYTWISSWTGGKASVVRVQLEESAGGTLVKLEHSGLANQPEAAKGYSQGWPKVLTWLQAFIEKGETIDTRKA